MQRPYELVMVVSPEVKDDAVPAVIERFTKYVSDHAGTVESQDLWGKRRLAYLIDKFREGQYVVAHFQLEPSATAELESQLRISEDIIRHLLVRRDE